jgi:hypothetical protein
MTTSSAHAAPDISPNGRVAARTFAAVLVATGVAVIVASWDELWRGCGEVMGRCVERSAGASLLAVVSVAAILLGSVIWWRTSKRPVDEDGSSAAVWWLGVVFALGMMFVANRIPAYTCATGRLDELLVMCQHPPTVSEPARWLWAKEAIVVVGIAGGIAIGIARRHTRITAPLAVLGWVAGAGWLILETLVRHSG